MTSELWEGARRLPYFFTVKAEGKDWIFCPQCALAHAPQAVPRYTTLRSLMCCRCGIVMGPINKAEMEEIEVKEGKP